MSGTGCHSVGPWDFQPGKDGCAGGSSQFSMVVSGSEHMSLAALCLPAGCTSLAEAPASSSLVPGDSAPPPAPQPSTCKESKTCETRWPLQPEKQ